MTIRVNPDLDLDGEDDVLFTVPDPMCVGKTYIQIFIMDLKKQ